MAAVADLAGALIWYDRKDDEDLRRGEIESAIRAGEITIDEIVSQFAAALDVELLCENCKKFYGPAYRGVCMCDADGAMSGG